MGGDQPIFWLVGVNPPVPPPLGKTLYISVTYPELFWGDWFRGGAVMRSMSPGQSPSGGPGGKAPRRSKDLVLTNHLSLINPFTACVETNSISFFQKYCLTSSLSKI